MRASNAAQKALQQATFDKKDLSYQLLRKQEVLNLATAGKTPSEIAKELQLDLDLVKKIVMRMQREAIAAMLDHPGELESRLKHWLITRLDAAENLNQQLADPEILTKDPYAIKAVADAAEQAGNQVLKCVAIFAARGGSLGAGQGTMQAVAAEVGNEGSTD